MELISGKCPECGAYLKISDKATGQLNCPYCGTECLVEDAVINIVNNVTNNVVNNTDIDTANINVNLNKDFVIKDGVLEKYVGERVDVVIPTTVREIADHAFSNVKIETVKIPDSVTSIGERAFSYCSELTSITISDSVTSIGENAFDATAWYDKQPEGLIYIGKVAYKYKGTMQSNTSIVIKDGILSIGDRTFFGCENLTSITIPNSVTSIGDEAFYNCTNLTSITIGYSVTNIGRFAFFECSSLTSIIVEENNSKYDSRNNCNAIIEKSTNTLIFGCKNTTIPDSVTSIGSYAFSECSNLTSITIPNSITSIGEDAF